MRFLVCLVAAALGPVATELQLGSPLAALASRWLSLSDSILLSSQRKLSALALASLLAAEASTLPLAEETLSFCVSVLAELEPTEAGADGSSPHSSAHTRHLGGEHTNFTHALAQSALEPLECVPLRPTLQRCLAGAAAAHGDALRSQLQTLDPSLLGQVVAARAVLQAMTLCVFLAPGRYRP